MLENKEDKMNEKDVYKLISQAIRLGIFDERHYGVFVYRDATPEYPEGWRFVSKNQLVIELLMNTDERERLIKKVTEKTKEKTELVHN